MNLNHLFMKKTITFLTALLVTTCIWAQSNTPPTLGDGTSGNPYQIATLDNLYWLSQTNTEWAVGKYFIQTVDIDASSTATWDGGKGFTPIGKDADYFLGQYDGQGFTISNLTINRPDEDYVALFGYTYAAGGTGGRLDNIGIINANIIGKGFVGALVGKSAWLFEISNCYAANVNITGSEDYVGGILGSNHSAFIDYCWTSGTVTGRNIVGGLTGFHRSKTIGNNYSSAVVNGTENVGGLIGQIDAGGNITNCYSVGKVNGTTSVGGLIGINAATATSSYYNSETSGQSDTGKGDPKTTAELLLTTTFVGWDFASTWTIVDTETAPYLTNLPNAAIALAANKVAPANVLHTQTVTVASMGNATSSLELTEGPANMTLTDGVISWTPTQTGTETATIKITGSNGLISSSSFSISTLDFDGQGTADSPFEIATLDQLKKLSESPTLWDKYYIQTADIDASATVDWDGGFGFTPIGNSTTSFTGSYNGKGFTISNLFISRNSASERQYMGMFGWLNGTLDSIYLISPHVEGYKYIGSLAGYIESAAQITNCYAADVTIISNGYYSGGLVSYADGGNIENCWVTGILDCGANRYTGGFIGYGKNNLSISNCYSTADAYGGYYNSGFIAYGNTVTVTNCYSQGFVNYSSGGGFNQYNTGSTLTNCYYNTETSGKDDTGKGEPKTTAELMQNSTFVDWDFTDTWSIVNGEDFPSLKSVGNAAVVFPIDNTVAVVGTPYTETVSVVAMGNATINMELTKKPEGMTISTEGIISWTPTQKGNDTIIVKVTDEAGFISTIDYSITTVSFGGGGTKDDPFTIATLGQLKELAETPLVWDKYYLQTADIDAMETHTWDSTGTIAQGFSPIGNSTTTFTGSYNGGGFNITNLYINRASTDYIGLFGYVSGTSIDKLALSACNITGKSYVGALVGRIDGDSVSNAYASGAVAGYSYIGGLVGRNAGASIANCYSSASVSGSTTVGGLVGLNAETIINCYATGAVSAYSNTGGLVGSNSADTIYSSYYNYETSGQSDTIILKGEAKTIADMKQQATFVDWDFTNAWEITASTTFPRLKSVVDGPIVVLPATTTILANTEYKESIQVIGMDNQTITKEIIQKPETMVVTGDELVYTPTHTGIDTVIIKATDETGLTATQMFYINASYNFNGEGTEAIPYEIASLDELKELSEAPYLWDRYFIQTADIDATETNTWNSITVATSDTTSIEFAQGFSPIGSQSSWFTGSYDAQGFSISNLYINREETSNVGLFGYISKVSISNLSLNSCSITGAANTGALLGYGVSSTITACNSMGSVTGASYAGGLVGNISSSTLKFCNNSGSISGSSYLGGLVGNAVSTTIDSCFAIANVSGWSYLGGLVGSATGTITDSYTTGTASGSGYVGGLVGSCTAAVKNCNANVNVSATASYSYAGGLIGNISSTSGTVESSYATGDVFGLYYTGGFIGDNRGIIDYCYATGAVNGTDYSGGFVGNNGEIINNSYATGSVSGNSSVGGFAGYNYFGDLLNCYSIGLVTASTTSNVGGFLGNLYAYWTTTTNCYYNSELSGQSDNVASKGEPKTSAEMKDALTFAYWDFEGTWTVTANTFPTLDTVNNAPFAFADTNEVTGNSSVLLNDYDYETAQANLVAKQISVSSKGILNNDGYYHFNYGTAAGTKDTITYRVGELIAEGDTLWGGTAVAMFTQIANTAPVLTALVNKSTNENTPIEITMADVTATDADSDMLYVVISDGLNFTTVSPTVIVPNAGFYGNLTVSVGVTDGNMISNKMDMTITVVPVPDATIITWNAPDTVLYGTAIGEGVMNATTTSVGTMSYNFTADSIFNVGSYELIATFTPTEANDYTTAVDTVIYVVEKVMLTATADNHTILEGADIPELTISYSGFVNNEIESVLNVVPTATTNATSASEPDIYRINISGGSDNNYDFTYVWGELTIIERVLTVSVNELSIAAIENSTATFDIYSNNSWTISSSESWLTADILTGADTAMITLTAEANTTNAARIATITISGEGVSDQVITVNQEFIPEELVLTVSTTEIDIDSTGVNTAAFDINSNIAWTVTSSESWLTSNPVSGENDATVTLTAEANTTGTNRTATITVAGEGVEDKMIIVNQSFINGLSDESLSALTIYPNPASTVAYITNAANATVKILNITGQVLYTNNVVSDMEQINVSNFESGIYCLL
jgi:hypothetical protein